MDAEADKSWTWRIKRYQSIQECQARDVRKRFLISGFTQGTIKGAYIGVGSSTARYAAAREPGYSKAFAMEVRASLSEQHGFGRLRDRNDDRDDEGRLPCCSDARSSITIVRKDPMSTAELGERIKALPKDKALRVEALVTTLEQEAPLTQFPQQVLDEITAFRESLRAVHGTFPDSAVVIRELRENGF